uniref:Neuropeptide FF receptor 1-like n=1 Tax=Saccoglossus kowalevskii TaxID=10224 RepID=A0ABM0MEN2_SACKO
MTTTTDQVYLERLLERNPKLADHLRLMETTMDINDFCGGLTAFNITPLNNMNVTDIDDIPFYSYDCENLVKQMVDHFISSQYTHTKPSTIMLMILNFAVFVAAVIGNTLVIIVVARNAHMRNVTNYFLVNLAVADLLVAMFCVPFQLGYDIYTNWVYGTAMCKLTGFLQ